MSESFELALAVAETKHAKDLLDYAKQIGFETEFLSFGPEGIPLSVEQEAIYLEAVLESDNQLMLVALNGDQIIGLASVGASQNPKLAHVGEIGVSVLKEYWGYGIGSILLDEMITWAWQTNCLTRLELDVVATNEKAIHLYKKFGFTTEGTLKQGIKLQAGYQDLYRMALLKEEK
ncbi:Protein N-acetyltransferase, RimJ/RimL family [Granulicatella balaenopterae]|uniref:Protein N-acetyltransferase, RimJ/RimL family n=1 Tax=Granulicatella balaenopterae TaxID=137733 RepID=A0A1H9JK09_9LACT|nr:GNAT family protein [Granulicatella balaenopterae]SEQ87331.1 Protein N-acetyltransferase, RimJ/RimL family [Granulicatella balaenopterae]